MKLFKKLFTKKDKAQAKHGSAKPGTAQNPNPPTRHSESNEERLEQFWKSLHVNGSEGKSAEPAKSLQDIKSWKELPRHLLPEESIREQRDGGQAASKGRNKL